MSSELSPKHRLRSARRATSGRPVVTLLGALLAGCGTWLMGCAAGPERTPRQPVSGVDRPSDPVQRLDPAARTVSDAEDEDEDEDEESSDDEAPEKS